MSKRLISIRTDEYGVDTHLRSSLAHYATLCRMDGDDPEAGQYPAPLTHKHITCPDCIRIIEECKGASRYIKKKP